MYYLVSGASGQVGKELMKKLGKKAIGFDIRNCDGKKILYGDLTEKQTLKDILEKHEICGVYHPAAIIDFYKKNIEEVNVNGTKNLLEAIVETGTNLKFFVNFGTAGCYGGTPETGAKETDELKPIDKDDPRVKSKQEKKADPYVRSKIKQEKIAFSFYEKEKIPIINVRPGMIYGEEDTFRFGVHGLIVAGWLGLSYVMIEGGKYKTHCIHSKDAANAVTFLAEKAEKGVDGVIGETFNIADSTPISLKDFMTILAEEIGCLPPKVDFPESMMKNEMELAWKAIPFVLKLLVGGKVGEKEKVKSFNLPDEGIEDFLFEHHVFDTSKIKALGWKETIPLEQGLRKVIRYKLKQGVIRKDPPTIYDYIRIGLPMMRDWMMGKYGLK